MLDALRNARGADEAAAARLEAFRAVRRAPEHRGSGSARGAGEFEGWVPDLGSGADAVGPEISRLSWLERIDPGRRGLALFVVVAVAAGAIGAGAAWRARPSSVQVGNAAPVQASATPVVVVVDVAGRVRRPGLVRLPLGSRVADAIAAAGGALPGADLAALNRARKVTDGEQLRVGVPAPTGSGAAGAGAGSGTGPGTADGQGAVLDLNTATLEQLDALPGVGPVLAQRIVDYRTAHGSFGAVAQLREVSGIGERKYEDLRHRVRV